MHPVQRPASGHSSLPSLEAHSRRTKYFCHIVFSPRLPIGRDTHPPHPAFFLVLICLASFPATLPLLTCDVQHVHISHVGVVVSVILVLGPECYRSLLLLDISGCVSRSFTCCSFRLPNRPVCAAPRHRPSLLNLRLHDPRPFSSFFTFHLSFNLSCNILIFPLRLFLNSILIQFILHQTLPYPVSTSLCVTPPDEAPVVLLHANALGTSKPMFPFISVPIFCKVLRENHHVARHHIWHIRLLHLCRSFRSTHFNCYTSSSLRLRVDLLLAAGRLFS